MVTAFPAQTPEGTVGAGLQTWGQFLMWEQWLYVARRVVDTQHDRRREDTHHSSTQASWCIARRSTAEKRATECCSCAARRAQYGGGGPARRRASWERCFSSSDVFKKICRGWIYLKKRFKGYLKFNEVMYGEKNTAVVLH